MFSVWQSQYFMNAYKTEQVWLEGVRATMFIWEAGDAVQNVFRAEAEMTTLTDSGLEAGLLGLSQVCQT